LGYWRTLPVALSNALEEGIGSSRHVSQFNRRSQLAGSETQRITLGSCPGTPFDNDDHVEREEALCESPLQCLDPLAAILIVEIDTQRVHPVVGRQANGAKVMLQCLGDRGLS
jgi:hypothetical protein